MNGAQVSSKKHHSTSKDKVLALKNFRIMHLLKLSTSANYHILLPRQWCTGLGWKLIEPVTIEKQCFWVCCVSWFVSLRKIPRMFFQLLCL